MLGWIHWSKSGPPHGTTTCTAEAQKLWTPRSLGRSEQRCLGKREGGKKMRVKYKSRNMAIKFKRLISNKRSLSPKHKLCDHSVISLEVKNNYHLKSCEAKHYQLSSLFSPKPSCMAFKMCSILFSWSTYYQILQFFLFLSS